MSDRDDATFNACLYLWPDAKHLMCYFHVAKNIKDRFGNHKWYYKMLGFIRLIHFSKTRAEMVQCWNEFMSKYGTNNGYKEFINHVVETWSNLNHGRWGNWQIYQTPTGT